MAEKKNITILISPLDWGLGHATRCIPIINFFLQAECKVIIAAEGAQEKLLKEEFPLLPFVHLSGYHMSYSRYKRIFILKIVLQLPKILWVIRKEKKWLKEFAANNQIDAIVSDNRFGFYHPNIRSIFITHQLLIKSPFAFGVRILQKLNYRFIEKFSACWIPDEKGSTNLGGTLSHPKILPAIPVRYLGGISRLEKKFQSPKFDLLIILSGPEPQRSMFEAKIFKELKSFRGKVLVVRGLPGNTENVSLHDDITIVNHLPANKLEAAFNSSEYIISRSGYTTVMDVCKLQKKSILVPTPGQTEQEYLAHYLQKQGWAVTVDQHDFSLSKILETAKKHEYRFPFLDMKACEIVVNKFVLSLINDKS